MATYNQTIKTGYTLQVNVTETVNESANTSTIDYSIYFIAATGYHYHYNYQNSLQFSLGGYSIINTANIKSVATDGQSVLLASGSWTYAHNSDGTGSFAVYCRFQQTQDTSYTATINQTFTCTTIGTASSFTATNGELGTASVAISITKADANYTHTLKYVAGTASGTIATKTANASVTWTPPITLAAQNVTGETVTCTLTCETYSGNTKMGSRSTMISLDIPYSVEGEIIDVYTEEVGTGGSFYIEGKSGVHVTGTISMANAQGAVPKNCSVLVDGVSKTAQLTKTSATTWTFSVTSDAVNSSGFVDIDISSLDSRGRVMMSVSVVQFEAYTPPHVRSFSVKRCDANGTPKDDGEYVLVEGSFPNNPLGGSDTYSAELTYAPTSGGTEVSKTYYTTPFSDVLPGSGGALIDANTAYTFTLTVTDLFASASAVKKVGPAFVLMDFLETGKGVAFGKQAESAIMEVAMDESHTGNVDFENEVNLKKNDGTEQSIDLYYCGSQSHKISLYKGASNSTTVFGIKDATSNTSILRYCTDGKLHFDVPVVNS